MWKIDLGYREEFQSTFERLYQKKQDKILPDGTVSISPIFEEFLAKV
jgi:hypothetical protein